MEESSYHILEGYRVDIYNNIGKLPKQKSGWLLPRHCYCGPYNALERNSLIKMETLHLNMNLRIKLISAENMI